MKIRMTAAFFLAMLVFAALATAIGSSDAAENQAAPADRTPLLLKAFAREKELAKEDAPQTDKLSQTRRAACWVGIRILIPDYLTIDQVDAFTSETGLGVCDVYAFDPIKNQERLNPKQSTPALRAAMAAIISREKASLDLVRGTRPQWTAGQTVAGNGCLVGASGMLPIIKKKDADSALNRALAECTRFGDAVTVD
jgi:hypothetical protein